MEKQKFIIKVPEKELQSPTTTWASRPVLKAMLMDIDKKFGSYIDFASKENNIPRAVIISFIAVESGGKVGAGGCTSSTTGLMQWNRTFAKSQLETEYSAKRLSDAEIKVLSNNGIKFNASGKTRAITCQDQMKPEVNILIGTILLGQIIDDIATKEKGWAVDESDEGNVLRLDKIIAVYNAGAYSQQAKIGATSTYKGKDVDTSSIKKYHDVIQNISNTTSSYIRKFLGKDGAMDILTSELKDLM